LSDIFWPDHADAPEFVSPSRCGGTHRGLVQTPNKSISFTRRSGRRSTKPPIRSSKETGVREKKETERLELHLNKDRGKGVKIAGKAI